MEVCSSSDNSGLAEKTTQQKIWIKLVCFVRAVRPAMLYLLLPSGMALVGMVFRDMTLSTAEFLNTSGNFYYGIGVLGTFYLLHRDAEKKGKSIFGQVALRVRDVSYKRLALLYVVGLACGILLSVLLTAVSYVTPALEGYRRMSTRAFGGKDFILLFFTIALCAPVVEEIIFRGFMYGRLQVGFEKKTAVFIASFLFAVCHVSPFWMAYAFAAALLLCRLLEENRNLLFPMVFHGGFNMSSILLYVLTEFLELPLNGLWIGGLGAAAGGAGLLCYMRYQRGVEIGYETGHH